VGASRCGRAQFVTLYFISKESSLPVMFCRIKTTMLFVAVSLCVVWETKLLAVGCSSIKQQRATNPLLFQYLCWSVRLALTISAATHQY